MRALRMQYIICVQLMNLARIDDEHTTDMLFNSVILRVQNIMTTPGLVVLIVHYSHIEHFIHNY